MSRACPHDIAAVVFDVDGVLTDGSLYYGDEGERLKVFSARDGMGMAMLRDSGVRMGIVSGRASPVIEARVRELGVDQIEFRRMDKAEALAQLAANWGLPVGRIACIGDDVVDVPMLRRAGFAACPSDADPRVQKVADLVCDATGGRGAVRQLAEVVLRARGDWSQHSARFELEDLA